MTDAGCVLHQHWLQEITSPLVDPDVHIVSGWYEPLGEGPFQTMYRDCFLLALEDLDVAEFLPSSRSMALRKACWSAVGGYPIAAATAEDTGFCLTLRGHGFCFYFAPAAVVFWRAPQNLREAMVKHFRYAHGDGVMGLYVTQYLIKMAMIPIPLTIILPQKRRRHFFGAYPIFLAEQIGFLTGYALARCREDALERI